MKKIFILHGWAVREGGQSREMWKPFIDELSADDLEIIFLKIPGLTAPLKEVWGLDDYVSWLSDEIESRAAGEKVVLIGHSFGGQIASRFASKNNRKVDKLVLIDSSGIKDMSIFVILKRSIFFLLAKFGKLVFKGDLFRNILYKLARESDYKKASPLLRKTMANILDDQVLEDLPNIDCDTKIIWGSNDKVTPVKHARKFNSLIAGSVLEFVDGARHSPQFTHPEKTSKIVSDFIL